MLMLNCGDSTNLFNVFIATHTSYYFEFTKGSVCLSQKGYDQKFKESLVKLYRLQVPVSALSIEYGVSKNTIYRWIKQHSLEISSKEITFSKVKSIQKENLRLRCELEILKEAMIIFARNR